MTVVFAIVLAMLSVAGLLTVLRILRGPDTLDRVLALDVLVVLVVAGAAVAIAIYADGALVPLLAGVALVGFVGSATAARLVEHRERHR